MKACPQSESPKLLYLSGDSPEPLASKSSWAGTCSHESAMSSAAACSGSQGSSDSASGWPNPQSEYSSPAAWMQNMDQSSQLEEPTTAALEAVVVAWHAALRLLPCEHHHHYHHHHPAPVLQHPCHLLGRESRASKKKQCHS